jgi:RND family efflux transporter MFP subunit
MNKTELTFQQIKLPKPILVLKKVLLMFFIFLFFVFTALPWQQNIKGLGYVIAANPNSRTQNLDATVNGRISKWFVKDGDIVKQGDKLVEIIDNDPLIIDKLKADKNIKERKYELAKIASETSKINYQRQQQLFAQGLASRKNYEDAKIEYKKLLTATENSSAEVLEASISLARQESQLIVAPSDGTILKVLAGNNSTTVKAGEKIATFAPKLQEMAVELYVDGNDIPLIQQGRKVRLQFEGWPAMQFSGWPTLSVGTFAGIVSAVDNSVSDNGKFRVIVIAETGYQWPDPHFLKHGAKVYGWILLNKVSIGYEVWRQINGFPADFDLNIKKTMPLF